MAESNQDLNTSNIQLLIAKLDGLETNINNSLRSMNNKIEANNSELKREMKQLKRVIKKLNDKFEIANYEIKSMKFQQLTQVDDMSVLTSLANKKKAKLDKQQSLQWSFFSVLHVVAAAGFIRKVQRCAFQSE